MKKKSNLFTCIFFLLYEIGHASMVGCITKKIVGYGVMSSSCRICAVASKQGVAPQQHDCRKNWNGSSKAMEPAMAVNILTRIKDKGHQLKKLVMDDDTTTIAKVRNEVESTIEKCSDKNHTMKIFTNALYSLQKDKKLQRVISTKTINHIKKCFSYAISKNIDAVELKENLVAIPHHLFGNHQKCDVSWCRYLQNPDSYVPRNLPYGKYLSNQDLFDGLLQIFKTYAEKSDRLLALGSTQSNESFNAMVSAKNPKNRFYSDPRALPTE